MNSLQETLLQRVHESVDIVDAAGQFFRKYASEQTLVENKADLVAEILVKNGFVDSLDKQRTVELLKNPQTAMDVLAKVAELGSKNTVKLGHVVNETNSTVPQNGSEADRVFSELFNSGGAGSW